MNPVKTNANLIGAPWHLSNRYLFRTAQLHSARKETSRKHNQRIVATSCILQKAKGEVAKAAVRRYSPKVERWRQRKGEEQGQRQRQTWKGQGSSQGQKSEGQRRSWFRSCLRRHLSLLQGIPHLCAPHLFSCAPHTFLAFSWVLLFGCCRFGSDPNWRKILTSDDVRSDVTRDFTAKEGN
jgi:hypothetical protein